MARTGGEYNSVFKITDLDHTLNNVVYLLTYDDGSRYIGSTKNPLRRRISKHFSTAKLDNGTAVNTWVHKANVKAFENNENVIVTVLRALKEGETLKEIESKYIKFYKEHSKCYNMRG